MNANLNPRSINCSDAEMYLEPIQTSTIELLWEKNLQKRSIIDVRLDSKQISEMEDSEDKLKLVNHHWTLLAPTPQMVKHSQTICRQIADEFFDCVWPFSGVCT